MVYAEILVFQNRVISKNVYEIVFVCPPLTARKKKSKFRASKCVKMANSETLDLQSLISRKICFTKIFCNIHILKCESSNWPKTLRQIK